MPNDDRAETGGFVSPVARETITVPAALRRLPPSFWLVVLSIRRDGRALVLVPDLRGAPVLLWPPLVVAEGLFLSADAPSNEPASSAPVEREIVARVPDEALAILRHAGVVFEPQGGRGRFIHAGEPIDEEPGTGETSPDVRYFNRHVAPMMELYSTRLGADPVEIRRWVGRHRDSIDRISNAINGGPTA